MTIITSKTTLQATKTLDHILFPAIKPIYEAYIKVSEIHSLWYAEYGNPKGVPVILLHGGPGAGISESYIRSLDPGFYRIIAFDQRGAKRSKPFASLEDNTTKALIDDIEKIRKHLNIDKFLVFGGSWGSTLAMLYGQAYPERCSGFILRGIFCATREEYRMLWSGVGDIFPEVLEEFVNFLPPSERDNIIESYHRRLVNEDPNIYLPAAESFIKYDTTIAFLTKGSIEVQEELADREVTIGMSKIFAHYSVNDFFLKPNQVLENINLIKHLPAIIVHGRYDIICRAQIAYKVHKLWEGSELIFAEDAGHSSMEPTIASELVLASEKMKGVFT
ncbi:MAG: prolyl aminopeptidase [Pseudomonadota bacterium]